MRAPLTFIEDLADVNLLRDALHRFHARRHSMVEDGELYLAMVEDGELYLAMDHRGIWPSNRDIGVIRVSGYLIGGIERYRTISSDNPIALQIDRYSDTPDDPITWPDGAICDDPIVSCCPSDG